MQPPPLDPWQPDLAGLYPRHLLGATLAALEQPVALALIELACGASRRPLPPACWQVAAERLTEPLDRPLLFAYGRTLLAAVCDVVAADRLARALDSLAGGTAPLDPRAGAALRDNPPATPGELIERADRALGRALAGGDRLCWWAPEIEDPPGDPLGGILGGDASGDHARVELLAGALTVAAEGADSRTLLRELLDRVIEGTGAQRGVLLLRRADGGETIELAHQTGGRKIARLESYSRSIIETVFRSGTPRRIVRDPAEQAVLPPSVEHYCLQTVLCAPLCDTDGRALGALYLDSEASGAAFSKQDLAFVAALGRRLGRGLLGILARDAERATQRRLTDALAAENRRLRHGLEAPLVARSPAIRQALDLAEKVAPTDATVLICGESGTGKERIAQWIHRRSRRAAGPLVVVNCAAIPVELIESELFGHCKGAFTGATEARPGKFRQADGGTLLLDEIGELRSEVQAKLLRALQQGEIEPVGGSGPARVDVRILAATHRDLLAMVDQGSFREDLFFRLNVFPILLPPLRDRTEEIPELSRALLDTMAERIGRPQPVLSAAALDALRAYHWPGNVRELANALERALILAGERIEPEHLLLASTRPAGTRDAAPPVLSGRTLKQMERAMIVDALERAQGNKSRAARMLGIPRSSLYTKLDEHGLD